MTLETLHLEIDGPVAVVTLNRPERLNAIDTQLKQELDRVLFKTLAEDPGVRCAIVTGAGERAFCAGADIRERAAQTPSPAEFHRIQRWTQELFSRIAGYDRPTIAAINGLALGGGCELALACDIRIAADGAQLGLPEVNLGIIPTGGGTQRLPRLVGAGQAKRLILSSARIGAAEALRIGLVDEVVPAAELMARARELARTIADKPPLAVRFAKRAIDQGLQTDIVSGHEYELYAASILFDTADRKEGMRAFVDKRKPRFEGK
ncbi:MAG: crotonase [Alphaproteobacteria bacterium]|nr:crotonase [Alphaproteobacteria bacterium]